MGLKNPFSKKTQSSQDGQTEEKNGFAWKIGQFFSPEPQKEKVLSHEDFNAAGDVYYANVSVGYKIAQRILWFAFILFMIFSIIINYKEITYDNFFYLIKDFSSAVDAESTNYETVSYESDPRQNFALYRGGIAAVSPSGVSSFTATGRRTLRAESGFSSPYVVCSDKYMLVYDTAGTTFSIYNSFSRIYTESFQYPITNACFAEDGTLAVVTREADAKAVVYIYDNDFDKIAKYKLDSYMFDVSIDSYRNMIAFVYYGIGNGTGETLVSFRALDTLEEIASCEFSGEFPLECGFIENELFVIITDGAIRIVDGSFDDNNIEAYEYFNGHVTGYCVNESGAAVSVTVASRNEIIAFDSKGDLLYNDVVRTGVTDIGISGKQLFLQTEGGVTSLNTETLEEEFLSSGNGKLLVYNSNTVLICGESKAEYLVFGK